MGIDPIDKGGISSHGCMVDSSEFGRTMHSMLDIVATGITV
jgi:hypothetical protein